MTKKKDTSLIKYVGKVILITLLTVLVLRCFFFEFFTISTTQMESTLMEGDEVLVSKVSYGPRLPITPLSVPFTFDKLYSGIIEFPYTRLFGSPVRINDVVVFNTPLASHKPLDKRNLLISRCVAIPGDTILLEGGMYYINSKEYVHSPSQVNEYWFLRSNYKEMVSQIDKLDITITNVRESTARDTIYFRMSDYNAYILKKNTTSNILNQKITSKELEAHRLLFIVPSYGREAVLTDYNTRIYKQIIALEQGNKAHFVNNEVYIGGKKADKYTFEDDYYWMLSDNRVDGMDSRELGFIPFKHVVGKASLVLYCTENGRFISDRFFINIQ